MRRILGIWGNKASIEIQSFIKRFDTQDWEIHIVDHIEEYIAIPANILGCLEAICLNDKEEIPCIFASDVLPVLELVYRLYHQVFDCFVYIQDGCRTHIDLPDIYQALLAHEILPEERLYKPVYCNKECGLKQGMRSICLGDEDMFLGGTEKERYQKYFIYKSNVHVFEPIIGDKICIYLDESSGGETVYHYPFLGEQIALLCEYASSGQYIKYIQDADAIFRAVSEQRNEIGCFQYHMFLIALEELLLENSFSQPFFQLHGISFLIKMTEDTRLLNCFLQVILDFRYQLQADHLYFLLQQVKRWIFLMKSLGGDENLIERIYDTAYGAYKKELRDLLEPIQKEERSRDCIVVMTVQFLTEKHAPTRTALERIYTLGKLMGKKVYVINTREEYTRKGMLPIYDMTFGRVIDEYNDLDKMMWKDYCFDFYQCPCNMPDLEEMRKVIIYIRKLKPYAVMTIGTESMLSDLCADILPVMGVPVVFSTIPKKKNQFTVIGRCISNEEKKVLLQKGYDLDRIIESTFTFDIKPQLITLTREELQLPKDVFVLGIIGIRLDYDVDQAFLEAMEQTLKYHTHLAFAGEFKKYSMWCERLPWLREYSTFVGFQEDVLAFCELIDLYVNPKRIGGGFSVIEAFCKGKPGITIRYGDVAAAAGELFCVENYEEMVWSIGRYASDQEYYKEMAEKGKKRSVVMTDSKAAMEEILSIAENRSGF